MVKNAKSLIISTDLYTTITNYGNFSIKSTVSIKRTPKHFCAKFSIKRTLQSRAVYFYLFGNKLLRNSFGFLGNFGKVLGFIQYLTLEITRFAGTS